MKYNGNDIFAPFNAGLYGADSDEYQSLQYEESKKTILADFKSEYEEEIKKALANVGITYVGLSYYSPRFYNYSTDSVDLECEVSDKEKLLAFMRTNAKEIDSDLAKNVSYDGYIALTKDTYAEAIEAVENGEAVDIIVMSKILSSIDFEEFEIYDSMCWAYQCDECKLIHEDIDYLSDEDKETMQKCSNQIKV